MKTLEVSSNDKWASSDATTDKSVLHEPNATDHLPTSIAVVRCGVALTVYTASAARGIQAYVGWQSK